MYIVGSVKKSTRSCFVFNNIVGSSFIFKFPFFRRRNRYGFINHLSSVRYNFGQIPQICDNSLCFLIYRGINWHLLTLQKPSNSFRIRQNPRNPSIIVEKAVRNSYILSDFHVFSITFRLRTSQKKNSLASRYGRTTFGPVF